MKIQIAVALFAVATLVGCDDKSSPSASSASASAVAPSAVPSAAPSAAPPASAAPTASAAPAAPAATGDSNDVVVTVKDPAAEPEKKVTAKMGGGNVTLYLPDAPGTVWAVDSNDKSIGKAKEEIIPGFAPGGVNGHQFQWPMKNPLLHAGESHKITFVNKKAGKPNGTFVLTINVS